MVRTLLQMRLTPRALEPDSFEWGVEAPGTTAHRLPALQAAATTAAAAVPPATVSGAPPIEPFVVAVPAGKVKEVSAMLKAIHAQEDAEAAKERGYPVAMETMMRYR
jgi:hypothetical protein